MRMRIQKNESLKKIFFLLYILTFVTFTTFVSISFKRDEYKVIGGSASSPTLLTQSNSREQNRLNPQPYIKTAPTTAEKVLNSDVGDTTASVQGASAAGCEAQNSQGCQSDTLAFQPVCTEVNASINLKGGNTQTNGDSVTVQKNSVVEIWKVTAPTAILSGKEAVEDSTYEITKDDPAFRSAGNLIDKEHLAAQFYEPGDARTTLEELFSSADTGDFSVNVSASFGGAGNGGASDAATIFPELESKCMDVQPSDPNPDRTNKLAGELAQFGKVPGEQFTGRTYNDPANPSCIMIDPGEIDLPNSSVYETCVNQRSPFDGIIGSVIDVTKWGQCLTDQESCEEVELVGLMIDAPFGSNQICNNGYCADHYFDQTIASGLTPDDLKGYTENGFEGVGEAVLKGHYVTTPCKVRIDYKDIYSIPCLWDVSPYKAMYDLEAANNPPGKKEFPTWEEYWALVEAAAEKRGVACGL